MVPIRLRRCGFALLAVLCFIALLPGHASAQHQHDASEHAAPPAAGNPDAGKPDAGKLGAVSFPTSCARSVQSTFERGLALLHSFEYPQAKSEFQKVEQEDPTCAIAYWGEAMTLYHQLWDRPSEADLSAGWKLVEKAQAANAKTDRERGYIDAAAAFYRNDAGRSWDDRSAAYVKAMEKLSTAFPQDHEAAAFYGLSLVASPHANDNGLAYRKKGVAILEPLFAAEPAHPGLAHYLIHACDNPAMAKQGLPAARVYAQIAPASPHALHMPAHIFARLGLWQDDIQSNLASKTAATNTGATSNRLHAMDYLSYAYLQTGDDEKQLGVEREALDIPKEKFTGTGHRGFDWIRVEFPAMRTLETGSWKEAAAIPAPDEMLPELRATAYWAHAVGAGHLRDAPTAAAALRGYEEAVAAVRKSSYAYVADDMGTRHDEAEAWSLFAAGKDDEAIRLLTQVADRQDKAGKEEVDIPAREMLGDALLLAGKPAEALTQFEQSLRTDPNRFHGLFGAGHAAELAHKPEDAARYYHQLLTNCAGAADVSRADLKHAREQAGANASTAGE